MAVRVGAAGLVSIALLAAGGCGGSSSPASSGPTSSAAPSATAVAVAPTVRSSLAGMKTLPRRVHWTAVVSDPSAVSDVRFLIDGQLGWVEKKPPYFYGDDGNWLVTSFLRPGAHVFEVQVRTAAGATATDKVWASTVPPAVPSAALIGRWQRKVSEADVKKATSGEGPPPGLWKLAIDAKGWHMTDPDGGGGSFDVGYLHGQRLDMRPTIEAPPYPNPSNGGFCDDTDPAATWAYAATSGGSRLTLHPDKTEPCGDRAAILEGTWVRV